VTFNNNTCNSPGCGKPIVWWNPETGKPEYHPDTNKKMPFNPTGGRHLCMKKGQDFYFEKKKDKERITDFFNK
jgi:hypothetical protein